MVWLRITAAAAVALFLMGGFSMLGFGEGAGDEAHDAAHRWREMFWLMIFFVVMATALLAAARRWSEHLRHATARAVGRRR